MPKLLQRVRRLEAQLTDPSGLAPHSAAWFESWEDILERLMAGEDPTYPGRFPLAVTDRIIERADREDGLLR